MSVKIINPGMISQIGQRHSSDYFLFISQMEFKSDLSDYSKVSYKTNLRKLKIHYTVFEKEGKKVFTGIADNEFVASINKVDDIIEANFNKISLKILSSLPDENLIIIKAKDKRRK